MMRFAEPHDLRMLCKQIGISLSLLVEYTGISIDDLLDYAAGERPLSAGQRFAILNTMCEYLDLVSQFTFKDGTVVQLRKDAPRDMSKEDELRSRVSHDQLMLEVLQEAVSHPDVAE